MRLLVSILLAALAFPVGVACQPRVIIVGHAVPADVQLNLSKVSRVWVAGFHADANREVDLNVETVKFLRSELRERTSLEVIDAEPLVIGSEEVFSNRIYWQQLAEEHGFPLIVTGTINFLVAPSQVVERARHRYITTGRVLEPVVMIIDGHTGKVVLRRQLPRRVRYGIGRFASSLSLYFELMNRQTDDWLRVIAAGAAGSSSSDEGTSSGTRPLVGPLARP